MVGPPLTAWNRVGARPLSPSWRLRRLPVCASTELELDRWLLRSRGPLHGAAPGLVVRAGRQRFGHGQRGRYWHSPRGGLWLSAAFPWPARDAGVLGLTVAVALALQLETFGLTPEIKWPNDLLVAGRKLAGVLPRLRLRGAEVRWAQVGIGLNGVNRVPPGAISLAQVLATRPSLCRARAWHPQALPRRLEGRVLAALDWTRLHASSSALVWELAQARLWRPPSGFSYAGQNWQVDGLDQDGTLRLRQGPLITRVRRQF